MAELDRRKVLAWALYDFGNSAFATTVMAVFFPLFFDTYWTRGVADRSAFAWTGYANAGSALLIAVFAPLLGTLADMGAARKRFLAGFTALGVAGSAALAAVGEGAWVAAMVTYGLAGIGFAASLPFYDALLVRVAPEDRVDEVSGIGYAAGYLGGGILLAVNLAMVLRPGWFALADSEAAIRVSFLLVAVWWGAFAVPLFLLVPEPRHGEADRPRAAFRAALARLAGTFRAVRSLRITALFLVAYWLYIDGVHTFIRMAVAYGAELDLPQEDLIGALLFTQFVGFPAAIVYGRLGRRFGAKRAVLIGVAAYAVIALSARGLDTAREFWILAGCVGLFQGGVQALSRSLYQRLIPPGREGEFFGFYDVLGKFAAILGPALMGLTREVTGELRDAVFPLLALFVAGGLLLWRVDVEAGRRAVGR